MTEGELLARQPDAQGGAEEAASSREALETALRLQRAADALISARTPEEVLDSVLTEGVRAAEARGGLIATLSDDGEWLDVVASRGYDDRYIEPFRRFPLAGNFPLSEAVRTGEGVFLGSERERDERYPELVGRSQPGHALVCLPLVGEHGPMGGLVFSFSSDQEFPPARRALKLALARQVALALERAHLAVAEQALRERLCLPRRGDCAAHLVARARADARESHPARGAAARRLVRDLDARRGDGGDRAGRRRPPGS